MVLRLVVLAALASISASAVYGADRSQRIIYEGKATEIANAEVTTNKLWITTEDLARATGFHIKPQGICRDELCFPVPAKRKAEFIAQRGTSTWFNLSEFASLINQPVAVDQKNGVWY